MFRLYKRLRPLDWGIVAFIVGLTILQVWCTMLMVDYTSGMITSIQLLNCHNSASEFLLMAEDAFGTEGAAFVGMLRSLLSPHTLEGGAIDWAGLMRDPSYQGFIAALPTELADVFHSLESASPGDIWVNAGMMVLVALGIASCQIVIEVLASRVTANLASRVRDEFHHKVDSFGLGEIRRFSTASLITRATNDVQQVSMCTLLVLRMVFAAPVTAIWAICKIQAVAGELTLATGLAVLLLVIALVGLMLLVLPEFKRMQKRIDLLNSLTEENLSGIRVVRAYHAEGYQEGKFQKANGELTRSQLFTGRVLALLSPVMMIVMNGLTLAIYWIGAYLMNRGGTTLDYASVSAFSSLATQIVMSFMMLLMMFVLWPRASVSARRINEVLGTIPAIQDPEVEDAPREEGTIEFRDVSFRYPDSEADVIEHVSFRAKKGDTVAFIGSTGSGKSTLVNLVPRLYDVSEGEVLVDGVDVRKMSQDTLRRKVALVPQTGVLFTGTVRSNVGLGVSSLSEEKCREVLRLSEALSFVEEMEGGLDAPIAQGGTNVSGGQRQRLCIARALAVDPEVLVFDDSFSALDFKTDRSVRENLAREAKGITKLIVAQRIGTIMDADLILVLQEGKVVGEGKHEELLQNCPVYRDIALSQMSKGELGL